MESKEVQCVYLITVYTKFVTYDHFKCFVLKPECTGINKHKFVVCDRLSSWSAFLHVMGKSSDTSKSHQNQAKLPE